MIVAKSSSRAKTPPRVVFYKGQVYSRIHRLKNATPGRTVMPPPSPVNAAFVRAADILGRFAVKARARGKANG
jgi:hypothetical protein